MLDVYSQNEYSAVNLLVGRPGKARGSPRFRDQSPRSCTVVAKKKVLKTGVAKSGPKGSAKASGFLKKLVGRSSFGRLLRSIREGEDASLAAFAKQLGIARTNLSDIELGRRGVSIVRAATWARLLGYHEAQFVKLALQAQLDEAGIKLRVDVHAA
jgi:plasmid maintenance system antidote protein VapI